MPTSSRTHFLALALTVLTAVGVPPSGGGTPSPPKGGTPTADWPLFRGDPLQTGVAHSDLPERLEVRWKFQAKDSIESAVAIAGGTVYAGSYDEYLYAIDLATGNLKWKYKAGAIKAPPSVHGAEVYVGTEEGTFHCVAAASGNKRWTFETGGEITSGANFAGNKVIFGSYDGNLYCLSTDGKLAWKVKTEGPVNGSPAVVGKRTFVAGCDSHLHMIDVNSGKEVGEVELSGQAAATAAIRGAQLYVGTMTNQVQAVDWEKSRIVWTFEPAKRAQPFYSSAAVTDKLVIAGSRDKKVYALERDGGKEVWAFTTGGRVDGSPVVVGKRVYAPSLDGSLYVLDLAGGKELQKLELGRGIAASPAVAGGCLVIGTTEGALYCLGKKE